MPDWRQNRDAVANLRAIGYHHEIQDWPTRWPYFLHCDKPAATGEPAKKRGDVLVTAIASIPNQDNYANKGAFLFRPTEDCTCTWCNLWRREQAERAEAPTFEEFMAKEVHARAGDGECSCGWKSEARKKQTRKVGLNRHIKTAAVTMAEAAD